jgi:hypothetical protein
LRHFLRRELGNLGFDFFNGAHGRMLRHEAVQLKLQVRSYCSGLSPESCGHRIPIMVWLGV